jgi:hypothetical protein
VKRKGNSSVWDHPIGLGHKLMILKIISSSSASGEGITIAEISRKARLTRQTVTSLVNRLVREGRITRIKRRYFMTEDIFDERWSMFAAYLSYLLIMGSVAKFQVDPIRRVEGNLRSNKVNGNDLESALFLIANRIGAFITFVLIEAMRPSKKIMSRTMGSRMRLNFIKSSISSEGLFRILINMLPDAVSADIVQGTQLRKASHDRLSRAFRNIYPSTYKAIIEGLEEYLHLLDSQSSDEN